MDVGRREVGRKGLPEHIVPTRTTRIDQAEAQVCPMAFERIVGDDVRSPDNRQAGVGASFDAIDGAFEHFATAAEEPMDRKRITT